MDKKVTREQERVKIKLKVKGGNNLQILMSTLKIIVRCEFGEEEKKSDAEKSCAAATVTPQLCTYTMH